uniref:Uncharacterized protein n=1 Tax=Prevotella sp. GTC17253 TaxID=3236793 RepID=A0AB33IUD0_9BACT
MIERATPYSIGKGEFVFSRNYPSQFFMIGDKTIFISSGQDVLQNQKLLKEVYHKLIKEDFLNSQKYYMLVFDAIDSVETVQEKQVYLSPEFDLIHGTHKTEDVDFIPPQIERDKN